MKQLFYTDLNSNSNQTLGDLAFKFDQFYKDKLLFGFILQELRNSIDVILAQKDISSDERIGAVTQLMRISDMFNGGAVSRIKKILDSKNKDFKKVDPEKIKQDFKQKVLK